MGITNLIAQQKECSFAKNTEHKQEKNEQLLIKEKGEKQRQICRPQGKAEGFKYDRI